MYHIKVNNREWGYLRDARLGSFHIVTRVFIHDLVQGKINESHSEGTKKCPEPSFPNVSMASIRIPTKLQHKINRQNSLKLVT